VLIDPRVHYIGMTAVRRLSLGRLPAAEIYVVQDCGQPVAVIAPYALYLELQERAAPKKTVAEPATTVAAVAGSSEVL
jgi:hypothetical protein